VLRSTALRRAVSAVGIIAIAALTACGSSLAGVTATPFPGGTPGVGATPPAPFASTPPTPPPSPVPLPAYQAGVNLLLYSDPAYATDLPPILAKLHRDHVNSVAVTFPFYMNSLTASSVRTGSGTPPDAQLEGVLDMLEGSGFSVMLRPLMDEKDLAPGWRGSIAPNSISSWFASYTAFVSHYATIAATYHVQVFDIGTELLSLEHQTADWQALIARVRSLYEGKLTYAVNGRDTADGFPSNWVSGLDFLSSDAYWDLSVPDGASVSTLANAWGPFLRQTMAFAGGKSLVLTEIGVVPQDGEQYHPWETAFPGPLDNIFQQRYYEAACQAATTAKVTGIYWWEVNLGIPGQFDPLGKPAEDAISSCFAAPPW
jgi:hypothetical protein